MLGGVADASMNRRVANAIAVSGFFSFCNAVVEGRKDVHLISG